MHDEKNYKIDLLRRTKKRVSNARNDTYEKKINVNSASKIDGKKRRDSHENRSRSNHFYKKKLIEKKNVDDVMFSTSKKQKIAKFKQKKQIKKNKSKRVTKQLTRNIESILSIVTLTKSLSKIIKARERSSKNVFINNFDDKKMKKVVNSYDLIEKLKNELSFSIKKNKIMFKKSSSFEKSNEILNVFASSIVISQKR